jgi:head-tail adaptor
MSAIGQARHVVTLENPGDPAPDGDGGYTETFAPLDPASWDCAITPASQRLRTLETLASATVLAQATHVLTGRYHPGITIETRLTFNGRRFNVINVANVEERGIETQLLAVEVLT